MRRPSLPLLGALLFAAGALLGGVTAGRYAVARAEAQTPPSSFEYQTVSARGFETEVKADKVLATFSHEGFRFAGTVGNLVVFERPRPVRVAPRPPAPKPEARPAAESID